MILHPAAFTNPSISLLFLTYSTFPELWLTIPQTWLKPVELTNSGIMGTGQSTSAYSRPFILAYYVSKGGQLFTLFYQYSFNVLRIKGGNYEYGEKAVCSELRKLMVLYHSISYIY